MYYYGKYILRETWIAIPAFIFAIYYAIILSGNVIEYFLFPYFGKWSVLISLPITWPYVYSPVLDAIMDFFLMEDNKKSS